MDEIKEMLKAMFRMAINNAKDGNGEKGKEEKPEKETEPQSNENEETAEVPTKEIKNGLSEIIQNCKPETKQDLEILKGKVYHG